MPVKNYGVLKGHARESKTGNSHFQVRVEDDLGKQYRIAINIASQSYPSEVLYFASEDFNSEDLAKITELPSGFTYIRENKSDMALDYIRGGLFDHTKMIPLPETAPGPDNDLNEKIDLYFKKAIEENATLYAFGAIWENENKSDQYFDFSPGNGIHDIHMNQGNVGKWKQDDGVWQDGGILIHFESSQIWAGIFLAFQSQSWCTDDKGHALRPAQECSYKKVDLQPHKQT